MFKNNKSRKKLIIVCSILFIVILVLAIAVSFNIRNTSEDYFVSGTYKCIGYDTATHEYDKQDNITEKNEEELKKYCLKIDEITKEDYELSNVNCVSDHVSKKYYKLNLTYSDTTTEQINIEGLEYMYIDHHVRYISSDYEFTITPMHYKGNEFVHILYGEKTMFFALEE